VFTSRDVVFHESILPYQQVISNTGSFIFPLNNSPVFCDIEQQPPASIDPPHQSSPSPLPRIVSLSNLPLLPSRRSSRHHRTPSYLDEYVCSNVLTLPSRDESSCCSKTVTSFCHNAMLPHSISCTTNDFSQPLVSYIEPVAYEEAGSKPEWEEAMKKEFEALQANYTWELVPLPKGKRPISCKRVYKIKYKVDGSLERSKARIVIRGFTQKERVDYTETFSFVVKMTTVCSLIASTVKKHWPFYQMDVNNAFLHGDLYEDIYMKLPQGLPIASGNIVYKLKKSLYRLKQASR